MNIAENPYAPPFSVEPARGADASRRAMVRAFRCLGWAGVGYISLLLVVGFLFMLAEGPPRLGIVTGMALECGVFLAFFAHVIRTASRLGVDFTGTYRRARWMAILAASIFFPVMTIPGILAIKRLETYRHVLAHHSFLVPMGKYAKEKWYLDHLAEMIATHGDFPPPWIYAKNSHPYSIGWRMGGGESHMMAFGEWWEQQGKSFDDRIAYFRKWPAPPRWCGWMADAIWDLEPWESEDEFDYTEYFSKLKSLGFEGTDDYESDLENENYD